MYPCNEQNRKRGNVSSKEDLSEEIEYRPIRESVRSVGNRTEENGKLVSERNKKDMVYASFIGHTNKPTLWKTYYATTLHR